MERTLKRARTIIPSRPESLSRVFRTGGPIFHILNFLSRRDLYRAMRVEKAWQSLTIQPGLSAWSYYHFCMVPAPKYDTSEEEEEDSDEINFGPSLLDLWNASNDKKDERILARLMLYRFIKLRHFHWRGHAGRVNWELTDHMPRSIERLAVSRSLRDASQDEKRDSALWLESLVEALPALYELRLGGFFFCELGPCFRAARLHTITITTCTVTDRTLSAIAIHSRDTLERLVLTYNTDNRCTGEDEYSNIGVRMILESCHRLKQLELGEGDRYVVDWKRITHEVWNPAGVVCKDLQTLCLVNLNTDDASLAAIVTLFPNLQEVGIRVLRYIRRFHSLLSLASLPQLRRLTLQKMGDLCLSKPNIQTLASVMTRIESFHAEIRHHTYKDLFRRLCPSPHLADLQLSVPKDVKRFDSSPMMRNWLPNEPDNMTYPYDMAW